MFKNLYKDVKQFRAHLTCDNKITSFLFTHEYTISGEYFFVSAVRGEVLLTFYMKKAGIDDWRITGPAPTWTLKKQKQLAEIIKANF